MAESEIIISDLDGGFVSVPNPDIEPDYEQITGEYLKLEKSLRTMFDSISVCSPCKGLCCISHAKRSRFDQLANRWDRYVISGTFPEWQDVKDRSAKDGYCQFLSEKGCIIPAGRPNACTTYSCYKYDKIMSDDINTAFYYFHAIGSTMARHMMDKKEDSYDGQFKIVNLPIFFKRAAETIKSEPIFKQKFDYKGV